MTDPLPDADHVVRYVRPTLIDNGIITGTAFCLHAGDRGVSTNWIEHFAGTLEAKLIEIRKRARLTYSKNGRLAKLNVRKTRGEVLRKSLFPCAITFVEDRLKECDRYPEDTSHALIMGVPADGDSPEAEAIGDLIAACVQDLFPAVARSNGSGRKA